MLDMQTLGLSTRPPTSFRRPLILEYIDGKHWRLVEAFTYEVGHLGSGETINIPAGFVTDFASIPPPVSWFWPPAGADYGKAAVVHDWLYAHPGSRSRNACDDVFREAMRVLGCSAWKRGMIYSAVRVGGWRAWGKHRTQDRAR